ncbi:DMT family transporter [Prosthecomicrobium sp. N25]|uniref:DMT family transporter n=1 Tax=Prosthecomicrobium sp. N25 TaxID=3129254 RepID=UPI0030769424
MTDHALPAPRHERTGIVLMLVGIGLFSIVNAVIKELTFRFSVTEIIVFRNFSALIPIVLMAGSMGGLRVLRPTRFRPQAIQALLFLVAIYGHFYAFKLMPITDATAISFAQPIIVVALSAPLLGERVTPAQWAAVVMGFAGVLLMVSPSGQALNIGALCAAGGTMASALSMLQLRQLTATDTSIAILFWTMAISGAAALPLLPFDWVTPTPWQALGLVATGVACGILQYLTTLALHHASAAAVAPTRYTSIVWALAIDVAWFAVVPSPAVLTGAAVVIAAAVLVLRREEA